MPIKIVQKEEKVLRQKTKEVPLGEISSPKIKKVLKDMAVALRAQGDGVAIAAPQIGVPLRIFLVAGKIFMKEFVRGKGLPPQAGLPLDVKDIPKDLVFINPRILKLSKKKAWLPEGCLSCRWLYGEVNRSTNATVEAYDERGQKFKRGAGGLLAQIFQHETDHLDGTLFIDKARDLRDMPPEKKTSKKQ